MRVEDLKNIGPQSAAWLHAAGIHTREDLEAIGPVFAYKVLKFQRPREVTRMLLYALQGAVDDVHVGELSPDVKSRLVCEAQAQLEVR